MSDLRLSQLKIGDRAIIKHFSSENSTIRRLQEMGLYPGTAIRIIKFAPFGDPLEIKIRGFHLSLRRALAEKIHVTKQNESGK
jgi:Fe2+ transport system protein FeoA